METWLWLLLICLMLMGGCAPGYYATGPVDVTPTPSLSGMTVVNPESAYEQERRIWSEEAGR